MKRTIAHGQTWWIRAFVLAVAVLVIADLPSWMTIAPAALFGLSLVRAPWDRDREPLHVDVPVRGRWVALNSPGTRVPSHGTIGYGQAFAVDILQPNSGLTSDEPGTTIGSTEERTSRSSWSLSARRPETYRSFGAAVHAMADGEVIAIHNRQRDHRDRTSWPALIYMLVVEGFCRELGGSAFILGNHVIVDHGNGVYSAYGHLRRGSVRVQVGHRVTAGDQLGEVGNSGNSSEPHLHVQLMDDRHPSGAAGIPFRWRGVEIRPGDTDPAYARGPVVEDVVPGLPANGQIFTAHAVSVS